MPATTEPFSGNMTRKIVFHLAEASYLRHVLPFVEMPLNAFQFSSRRKNLASFKMCAETKCKIHVVYFLYMIISSFLFVTERRTCRYFLCTTTIKKSVRAGILHVNMHCACNSCSERKLDLQLNLQSSKAKYPNSGLKSILLEGK